VIRWIQSSERDAAEPLPSERELAEQLRVSRSTVRAALQDLTSGGLIDVSESGRFRRVVPSTAQGNRPSGKALNSLLQNTVVVVGNPVPRDVAPPTGWDGSIQYNATRVIESAGLHVLSLNVATTTDDEVTGLAIARPKGALLTYLAGESAVGRRFATSLYERSIPIVTYGGDAIAIPHDAVTSDHASGSEQLTRLLAARGCHRVLRLWLVDKSHEWVRQRDIGHERALVDLGIDALPAIRLAHTGPDHPDAEGFAHQARVIAGYLAEHVLGPNPIDGLMLATDCHAVRAAAALRLLGKEPNRDVMLVGYDNSAADCTDRQYESTMPVATIDKNNPAIAAALVDLLQKRIAGTLPVEAQRRRVEPRLVICDPGGI